jgi:hypothetical protein
LQLKGAWQDSLTNDEITHIAAGVSYWRTGDFRLNDPHPALFKLWAAVPLLPFPHLNLDTTSDAWRTAEQWSIGEQFVFHSSDNLQYARWIVFAARIPIIVLWAAIGWMLYCWSRRHWNQAGGVMTLAAYTFDPNFLGHGHLVNNDVLVAGAFFGAIWATERALRQPTWKRVWILSIACALTVLIKFSGIFIYPVVGLFVLLSLVRRSGAFTWQWARRLLGAGALSFVVLSWVVYGCTVGTPFPLDAQSSTSSFITQLRSIPVPAPRFYTGLRYVMQHNDEGHPAYLLGQTRSTGWWYYFPVAIAVKTPLLTLGVALLVLMSSSVLLRKKQLFFNRDLVLLYTIPPLLFLGWAMTSHINIGLRHVFIIYPFLFAGIGGLAVIAERVRFPAQHVAVAATVGWFTVASIAGSHTIAYFNSAVGGTEHGQKILRDSNLDWQQDVWRLRDYLTHTSALDAHIELNAATDTSYFFPSAKMPLRDTDIAAGTHPTGTYAVSVRWLFDGSRHLSWLRSEQPTTIVGSTIWIYQF